jgi:hypothetical protein
VPAAKLIEGKAVVTFSLYYALNTVWWGSNKRVHFRTQNILGGAAANALGSQQYLDPTNGA